MIYLITVNYYSTDLIKNLLRSLPACSEIPYQLIVVNNSPQDYQFDTLSHPCLVPIYLQDNIGFGAACNLGLEWVIRHDPCALVWLVNPDTQLPPGSLIQAMGFFQDHPEVSLLGTTIYEPNGEIWFGGGKFLPASGKIATATYYSPKQPLPYYRCDWVSGCSLLLNLKRFPKPPQFDPEYFLYYEDFDLCQRCSHQGHIIGITPQIHIYHFPSQITNRHLRYKFHHSTTSYLLALEKHAAAFAFWWRLLRVFLHGLWLVVFQKEVGLGKLSGIGYYIKRRWG